VMWHVTAGLMNKQVAGVMHLSEITVKVHRGNVMRKMKSKSLAELVCKAQTLFGTFDFSSHQLATRSAAPQPVVRRSPGRPPSHVASVAA
jgi:hypothetical protein